VLQGCRTFALAALAVAPDFQALATMNGRVSARLQSTQRTQFASLAGVNSRRSVGTGRQVCVTIATNPVALNSVNTWPCEREVESIPSFGTG
jgi:hypothetical protein